MFIDSKFPESLGLQKMKNYDILFFVILLCLISCHWADDLYSRSWKWLLLEWSSRGNKHSNLNIGLVIAHVASLEDQEVWFYRKNSIFLPKVHLWIDHNSEHILSGYLWSVMIPLITLAKHFLCILHFKLSYHNLMVWVYYYFIWHMRKLRH